MHKITISLSTHELEKFLRALNVARIGLAEAYVKSAVRGDDEDSTAFAFDCLRELERVIGEIKSQTNE